MIIVHDLGYVNLLLLFVIVNKMLFLLFNTLSIYHMQPGFDSLDLQGQGSIC